MATVNLIGSSDPELDKLAIETAHKWSDRIQELFITERSKQLQIGISEVGMECRKCVARKLALIHREASGSWYPFIGTAVHDALERGFAERWPDEYELEGRLFVHEYKSLKLTGSCDMMAIVEGTNGVVVNDWKVVGNTSIADARKGKVKQQYRVQANLYGYGWEQKGYNVTHVALTFLPREDKLEKSVVVLIPYDKDLALRSLAELESTIDAAELMGWEKVIERAPKAGFCFSCKSYEQHENDFLASLI